MTKLSTYFDASRSSRSSGIKGVVTNSVEFGRIMALPRRVLDLKNVPDVTPLYQKPGGSLSFWPIQSAALIEASLADGLFAPIGVGHGKTLICLALPDAMESRRTVLLVKPDLKRQLEREAESFYGKHFALPLDRITVVAYSELSSIAHATVLEDCEPDLIIADEAHCLKRRQSARTKRFLRYFRHHPECRFAALSGTMTVRSITEYAHLLELALRKDSPLPRGYREIKDWAGALDVEPEYEMRPGVLKQFCAPNESVRSGYRRRMVETQGVVATEEAALGTSLVVRSQPVRIPLDVRGQIARVDKLWEIGGEEITLAADKTRVIKQLHCGFYYRWDWPNGNVDQEWLQARGDWHREVRERLKRAGEGYDSPKLLEQAAERFWRMQHGVGPAPIPGDPTWASTTWEAWRAVKHRPPPPTVPVWISDYLIRAAIEWVKKQDEPAIVWYTWSAVGERLAAESGLPFYGAGTDAGEQTHDAIVASVRAQGTGKNLQHYSRNLFLSLPPNGQTFEQTVARTHRPGQLADEVVVDYFDLPPNAFALDQIIEDAKYMQGTTGQRQKILYATRVQ